MYLLINTDQGTEYQAIDSRNLLKQRFLVCCVLVKDFCYNNVAAKISSPAEGWNMI